MVPLILCFFAAVCVAGVAYVMWEQGYLPVGGSEGGSEGGVFPGLPRFGGGGPSRPTGSGPGAVLDLRPWRLELPVGNGGRPAGISQPQLNSFSNDYFFVKDGGVAFRAPVDGVTTANSSYPRSELREMTSNGMSNAAWSTNRGTHTMEVTEAVTQTPQAKPHVCAAQVHGTKEAPVMIRLEGSRLVVTSYGDEVATLTTSYRLGTKFTVRLVGSGGGVTVFYNGRQAARVSFNDDGCYFKAGCYVQSNTQKGDKPGAYGEVVVYDLKVSHA